MMSGFTCEDVDEIDDDGPLLYSDVDSVATLVVSMPCKK